ncbi:MAG: peptide-methionine (S)-S-oxide reductase MsrA [Bacilli bacterium]|nr:peptide-methionine (S)-S-oxide reductase MsrA [Bacilli bacterium]
MKRIIFAGGCFWGIEAYFKKLKGVINTSVGYVNGNIKNPRYQDLLSGLATHAEAVEINYNENQISLSKLLNHLFRIIDPVSINQQGADIGLQYRSGVYYRDVEDKKVIENFIIKKNQDFNGKIAVEVLEERGYFLAEDYHQDYLDKNPQGYCHVNLNLLRPEEKKE